MVDLSKIYVHAIVADYYVDAYLGEFSIRSCASSSVDEWLNNVSQIELITGIEPQGDCVSLQYLKDNYAGEDFDNFLTALEQSEKYGHLFKDIVGKLREEYLSQPKQKWVRINGQRGLRYLHEGDLDYSKTLKDIPFGAKYLFDSREEALTHFACYGNGDSLTPVYENGNLSKEFRSFLEREGEVNTFLNVKQNLKRRKDMTDLSKIYIATRGVDSEGDLKLPKGCYIIQNTERWDDIMLSIPKEFREALQDEAIILTTNPNDELPERTTQWKSLQWVSENYSEDWEGIYPQLKETDLFKAVVGKLKEKTMKLSDVRITAEGVIGTEGMTVDEYMIYKSLKQENNDILPKVSAYLVEQNGGLTDESILLRLGCTYSDGDISVHYEDGSSHYDQRSKYMVITPASTYTAHSRNGYRGNVVSYAFLKTVEVNQSEATAQAVAEAKAEYEESQKPKEATEGYQVVSKRDGRVQAGVNGKLVLTLEEAMTALRQVDIDNYDLREVKAANTKYIILQKEADCGGDREIFGRDSNGAKDWFYCFSSMKDSHGKFVFETREEAEAARPDHKEDIIPTKVNGEWHPRLAEAFKKGDNEDYKHLFE